VGCVGLSRPLSFPRLMGVLFILDPRDRFASNYVEYNVESLKNRCLLR